MSRYVNQKHHMCIGSDNIFFIVGDGELRDDYRAIVMFDSYKFDQINTLNVRVKTPAQQLVWSTVMRKRRDAIDSECEVPHYVLNHWWHWWLKTNIGERIATWDVRTYNESMGDTCLFFKKRSQAVKFVRFVQSQLKGIK